MRLVLSGLLIVLLAGCVSQSGSEQETRAENSESFQRQLDLAVGYLRNGDYQRAKEKLNRALEIEPRNSAAHATYGLLFQLEGEPEHAEKYLKDAIRYDPDNAQARNSYGAFLFAEHRYHEAVKQLQEASENRYYANRPTVFENLGVAYRRIGDFEGAEYAFTRAIQLNPSQTRSMIELADIKFEQRFYAEARDLYRRYSQQAQSTPKSLWLCVRLARIFSSYDQEASCGQALEGIFPNSDENQSYQRSL